VDPPARGPLATRGEPGGQLARQRLDRAAQLGELGPAGDQEVDAVRRSRDRVPRDALAAADLSGPTTRLSAYQAAETLDTTADFVTLESIGELLRRSATADGGEHPDDQRLRLQPVQGLMGGPAATRARRRAVLPQHVDRDTGELRQRLTISFGQSDGELVTQRLGVFRPKEIVKRWRS